MIGSGQTDLYAGAGAVIAAGDGRVSIEAGYNARLPDTVPYFDVNRSVNPGVEEHLRAEGAFELARWLSIEASGDFTHRHATRYFVDAYSHDLGKAREMMLFSAGAALRAEISERIDAGIVVEQPVWGKSTMTFFPIDVTGPRGSIYYGVRF